MTLKRPKSKGTVGENEVLAILAEARLVGKRTSPGVNYDIYVPGRADNPFQILATRPDRGEWLATLRLGDVAELIRYYNREDNYPVEIEVKRYARFALHTIFEKKFGRK